MIASKILSAGVLGLPLLLSCSMVLLARWLTAKRMVIISSIGLSSMLGLLAILWQQLVTLQSSGIAGDFFSLATIGDIKLVSGYSWDSLTILMASGIVVTGILLQIAGFGYVKSVTEFNRFISYSHLSIFSLLLLMVANNLLQVLIGWQLLTIINYILVDPVGDSTCLPAIKARILFVHIVGDCALLLAIAAIAASYGSFDHQVIFSLQLNNSNQAGVIAGLLLLAAITKSCQIPFNLWLQELMAVASLPVGVIINVVTITTAGIVLLIKLLPIVMISSYWLKLTVLIGAITSLLYGILAISANAYQEITAHIIVGQLGMILVALGLADRDMAGILLIKQIITQTTWLLITSAIAGFVLGKNYQATSGVKLSPTLREQVPVLYWGWLILLLTTARLPVTPGFWANYAMTKTIAAPGISLANAGYYLLLLNNLVTVVYAGKLLATGWRFNYPATPSYSLSGSRWRTIQRSLLVLVTFVVLAEALVLGLVLSIVLQLPKNHGVDFNLDVLAGFFSQRFLVQQLLFSMLGMLVAWVAFFHPFDWVNQIAASINQNFLFVSTLLQHKYFFPELAKVFIYSVNKLATILTILVEKFLLNQLISKWPKKFSNSVSVGTSVVQNIFSCRQLLFMLVWTLVVILWLITVVA